MSRVVVNDIPLTEGEVLTLQVALSNLHSDMGEPDALGGDEAGRSIAAGYRRNAGEVMALLMRPRPR